MPIIRIPRPWEIPERLATPESVWTNRRAFIRAAGLGTIALGVGACGETTVGGTSAQPAPQTRAAGSTPAGGTAGEMAGTGAGNHPFDLGRYPADRNAAYTLDRALTDEEVASSVINYYEFTTDKAAVREMAEDFPIEPWTVQVTGLVEKPRTWGVDEIVKTFTLEERLYRHRCVEAWAMAVPWTGIPLARFIEACQPLSKATHVRFVSFLDKENAPGQKLQTWYPWPYFEGLTMAEATNELALLTTGVYGHPLPNEHGAPLRMVLPWKYGYKSIKGVVRVEFTDEQPPTFWNALEPEEYDFTSNVNPAVSHPRWSQARERLLGTGEMVDTMPFNGYADQVSHLYV